MTPPNIRRWFPWIEAGWLVALSPFILFITPDRWWLVLLVPVLGIFSYAVRGFIVRRTPLDWPNLVIAGMTLLSLIITPDMDLSLPKAAGLFLGLAYYYVVADLSRERPGSGPVVSGLLIIGVGIGVLGLLGAQWLGKIGVLASITAGLPRLISGLPGAARGFHPNEIAGALLWIAPIPVAWAIETRRSARAWAGRDILVVLAGVWITGVLLLTQSRSGWFGWILGMGAMLAWSSRLLRRLILLLCVIALVVVISIGPGRIGAALFGDAPQDTFGALNWDFRLEVWRVAVWGISDFPFTGMGIGVFREVGRILYPSAIPPDYDFAHAHNEFLQVALDLGLPGLIAFIALYLVAFWMLRQIWQSASTFHPPPSTLQPLTRPLVLGLAGGLFAHLIYGLTDAVALGAKPGFLFWMLLGLIAALFEQTSAARQKCRAGLSC